MSVIWHKQVSKYKNKNKVLSLAEWQASPAIHNNYRFTTVLLQSYCAYGTYNTMSKPVMDMPHAVGDNRIVGIWLN